MILTVKFWELPWSHRRVAARIVALGDQQRDTKGKLVDGILEGETLWSAPPSLVAIKIFILCCVLNNFVISINDARAAYLGAQLQGPPVYFVLPKELQEKCPNCKKFRFPVHRARKAVYGMPRAGHDYDNHARVCTEDLNWTSLRAWDSEPAVSVRKMNGERVEVPDVP